MKKTKFGSPEPQLDKKKATIVEPVTNQAKESQAQTPLNQTYNRQHTPVIKFETRTFGNENKKEKQKVHTEQEVIEEKFEDEYESHQSNV